MADEDGNGSRGVWSPRIISAILGIVVTVVAALLIAKLQSREPHLAYATAQTTPFTGANSVLGIYQLTVMNDGKTELENTVAYLRIPGATIEQRRTHAVPTLRYLESGERDAVTVQIPSLNPSESVQIAVLASSSYLPPRPEVSVRAKGLTGEEKEPSSGKQDELPYWGIIGVALSAVASSSAILAIVRRSRRVGRIFDIQGEDQRQILSFLCRMHDLNELADEYIQRGHEATYWSEADRLGQLAVDSQNPGLASKYKAVLESLLTYPDAIARTSKAIVLYNLARVSAARGPEGSVAEFLAQAREQCPKVVDKRLAIDPIMKGQSKSASANSAK